MDGPRQAGEAAALEGGGIKAKRLPSLELPVPAGAWLDFLGLPAAGALDWVREAMAPLDQPRAQAKDPAAGDYVHVF